jgi:hypothetical protein
MEIQNKSWRYWTWTWWFHWNLVELARDFHHQLQDDKHWQISSTIQSEIHIWLRYIYNYIAHEFSVEPKEGQLAKFGSKGTNFFVSFTPVEYGKEKKGKLVI